MTLRYAALADTTVRAAYDAAIGQGPRTATLPLVVSRPTGRPGPGRLAARRDAQDPRRARLLLPPPRRRRLPLRQHLRALRQLPRPAPSSYPQLQDQLADAHALRDDAEARGWDSEVARHARVIASLQRHLDRLKRDITQRATCLTRPRGPVNRLRLPQHDQLPAPYPEPHRGHPTAEISSMNGSHPAQVRRAGYVMSAARTGPQRAQRSEDTATSRRPALDGVRKLLTGERTQSGQRPQRAQRHTSDGGRPGARGATFAAQPRSTGSAEWASRRVGRLARRVGSAGVQHPPSIGRARRWLMLGRVLRSWGFGATPLGDDGTR